MVRISTVQSVKNKLSQSTSVGICLSMLVLAHFIAYRFSVTKRSQRVPVVESKDSLERRRIVEQAARSVHGKRVAQEIERIRGLSTQEMESQLDDTWAVFWSGAQHASALNPQLDFSRLLACRLRRRFIQTVDEQPPDVRRETAKQVRQVWMNQQKTHYRNWLEFRRDPTAHSEPPPRGIGIRLAVGTSLFCTARWTTSSEFVEHVEECWRGLENLRETMKTIPSIHELERQFVPPNSLPDHSCLVSLIVYAIRRDESFSKSKRAEIEELLEKLQQQGQLGTQTVIWNAWDASIDWFDMLPLSLDESSIDRRAGDEEFTFYTCDQNDRKASEETLMAVLNVIGIKTSGE
ncbi:MAG: hypothetical protein U0941_05910 [Planctomycetaceae bacterium]